MASILSFRQSPQSRNWTNEELAELFRVVDILGRAGVAIDTDMGLSDEGEPWFAFCRADTGDVIVHFSRIDGQFVAVSAATDSVVRGGNFRRVAETLVNRQPLILPAPSSGQKLFLHPAVILTALVATTLAQMKSWDGQGDFAFQDVSVAAPGATPEPTFAETLKTGLIDALNLVLRGFTGPVDARSGAAEHSGPTALGLGLGNLSLASIVAFAISVIQGSPLLEDANIAGDAPQSDTNAPVVAKNTAVPDGPQQMAADQPRPDAGAPVLGADIKEMAADKKAAHDAAVAVAMAKAGADAKASAGAENDGFVQKASHNPLEKLAAADTGAGVAPQKLPQATSHPDAVRTVESARAATVAVDNKDAVTVVLFTNGAVAGEQRHFSFTEISREAIEFFFVRVEATSPTREAGFALSTDMPAIRDGDMILASEATPVRVVLNASEIVFASNDPVALARLNQITNFVNSTDNVFSAPNSFPDLLGNYWSGDRPVTLVVFDSNDLPLNIFSFTRDVLFVEESQLAGLGLDTASRGLQVDLANGGDVTLLGVINLHPDMAA